MRPKVEIKEAMPWHCGQALRLIRKGHAEALTKLGTANHAELKQIFDQSIIRRVCYADGKMAALWGVTGSLLSNMGYVWLVLTEVATRYPIECMRVTRHELDRIMETQLELATTVLGSDPAALRFALALGFHVDDHELEKDRKKLARKIIADTKRHIELGTGFVIPLGYHDLERA